MAKLKLRKEGYIDTHIYLSPEEFSAVTKRAEEECRSTTAQILMYVRRGLAADRQPAKTKHSRG